MLDIARLHRQPRFEDADGTWYFLASLDWGERSVYSWKSEMARLSLISEPPPSRHGTLSHKALAAKVRFLDHLNVSATALATHDEDHSHRYHECSSTRIIVSATLTQLRALGD